MASRVRRIKKAQEERYWKVEPLEGIAKSQREISVPVGKGIGNNIGVAKRFIQSWGCCGDVLWSRWREGRVIGAFKVGDVASGWSS